MESNNQEFIDVRWFGTVGIVLVQDNLTLEYQGYIKDIYKKQGPEVGLSGNTVEQNDILNIMAYGNKFPLPATEAVFDWIVFDISKKWRVNNPEYSL